MANAFSNPTIIAKEMLRHLKNNCVMGRLVFRGYEEEWQKKPNGWKIGSSLTMKAPHYFRTKSGATIDTVDLYERTTTLTLSNRRHVAWVLTSEEMTYDIDKYSEHYLKPAAQALSNYIDVTLLGLYTDVPNQVGTPGTTPNSFLTFALANARLDEEAAPQDDRHVVVNPETQAYMADHLKGLLHAGIVGKVVTKGQIGPMGSLSGMTPHMSQNVNSHTPGTQAGVSGAAKNGASSEGDTTLAIDGLGSANTLAHGDIFTIGSVNSVNPISGQSTGQLRQFVVDSAATASAGAIAALQATPGTSPYSIYSASASETYLPYQTVDALPANDAAITVAGTASTAHRVDLAFQKNAFALACVPLEVPASVSWSAQVMDDGYGIRVIRDYDVTNDREYIRFDVLFGVRTINPFLACRIAAG